MADTYYTNFSLASSNNIFSAIWKLTRALKKSGWAYIGSGDGSSKDTGTTDLWGNNADPSLDSYPSLDSVSAWWCGQGPTTLKIPFIAASTGTFLRGEKITQASSAAEGEIVGYDFDGISTGHIVVLPRVGTFNNTNIITGSSSGATLTPNGTIVNFVRQVVFWKSTTTTTGSAYMQCVDSSSESSSMFSTLMATAGCTSSVAPGGGGTSNSFPSVGSFVWIGQQIANVITHQSWLAISTNAGKAQIVATNCTPAAGISADGTFWIILGDTSTATQTQVFGYFRVENSEDGDLDPFVIFSLTSTAYNNANVRVSGGSASSLGNGGNIFQNTIGGTARWRGWRRRGFPSGDAFTSFATGFINTGIPGNSVQVAIIDNLSNPETIACSYTSKRLREPVWLVSQDNTLKMRKGTPRWVWGIQGGTAFDTWDSKTKICAIAPSTNMPSIIFGPYDGATTPLQA